MRIIEKCSLTIIFVIVMDIYYNYYFILLNNYNKNEEDNNTIYEFIKYITINRSYKNVMILGMLAKYKWNIVKPFFQTLSKAGYKSEIICFVLKESDSIYNQYYKEYNIIPIYFSLKHPYLQHNNTKYPITSSLINQIPNIPLDFFFYANVRFFLINAFLQSYSNKFSYILTTDIRDVIFQSNPFHWNYHKGIYLSHETEHCLYKEAAKCQKYNYLWIKPFNPSPYILNQTFINAGQIFGSSFEMKEFMKKYTDFMVEYHFKNRTYEWTCDQGMLNIFVYNKTNFEYPVIIFKAETGYVRILGLDLQMNKNDYEPDDDLIIRNKDKTIPCMIHQYGDGLKYGDRRRRDKYKIYIDKLEK